MVSLKSLVNEGLAQVDISNVFYNPHMKLSRDISVEVIKRIDDELIILDAFSASGIRGIRYYLEANNVKKVDFLDKSAIAVKNIELNKDMNKVEGQVFLKDFESFEYFNNYNFIEIDPFGSPAKYIPIVISRMRRKNFYLSITATDTAVLCGKHDKACKRNYLAQPLYDKTCHETGLRILLGYIARIAFIYDYNIEPLLSFYYRHQIKIIVKLERDIEGIYRKLNSLGYIYKENNLEKRLGIKENASGPMWIDKYYSEKFLDINIELIKKIKEELNIPFHYDLHEIASYYKISNIHKIDLIIRELNGSRTHFNPKGIKTFENMKKIVEVMKAKI